MSVLEVACPTCKAAVRWEESSKWKPFCCERCRLIDLGAWADEQYRIEGRETLMEQDDPERNSLN